MSQEQLAAVTRLNLEFIVALEEGRRDKLPGQVYLKPFTKTCAEALGLDLKELYKIIDGETEDNHVETPAVDEHTPNEKKRDKKLPVVIILAVIIATVIYLITKTKDNIPPKSEIAEVVPAAIEIEKKQVNWCRPWEHPVRENKAKNVVRQNLILTASDNVDVNIISAGDTLFNGVFTAGVRKVFTSDSGFILNLSRNDCVSAFINGQKDPAIGSSKGRLINYSIGGAKQ